MNISEIESPLQYYFAYGMLTHPEIMEYSMRRHGTAEFAGRALLRDYKLEMFHHANIHKQTGSSVHGALWRCDDYALRYLDKVEGVPVYYNRVRVTVDSRRGSIAVWAYIMTPQIRSDNLVDPTALCTQDYYDNCAHGYSLTGLPINQLNGAIDEMYSRLDSLDTRS